MPTVLETPLDDAPWGRALLSRLPPVLVRQVAVARYFRIRLRESGV